MGSENSKKADNDEDLSDLVTDKYSVDEVQKWYADFIEAHPQKFITAEEFVETYHRHFPNGKATSFAQNLFRLFDLDNDGRINFRELALVVGSINGGVREDKLNWMFTLFDIDRDGFIRKHEMKTILKSLVSLGMKSKQSANSLDVDSTVEERVEEIYRQLDRNFDGLLSRQEFMQLANTNIICMDVFEWGVDKLST